MFSSLQGEIAKLQEEVEGLRAAAAEKAVEAKATVEATADGLAEELGQFQERTINPHSMYTLVSCTDPLQTVYSCNSIENQ